MALQLAPGAGDNFDQNLFITKIGNASIKIYNHVIYDFVLTFHAINPPSEKIKLTVAFKPIPYPLLPASSCQPFQFFVAGPCSTPLLLLNYN